MDQDNTVTLPAPPKLPEKDILVEIFHRITDLSDSINSPEGSVTVRLLAMEERATIRHVAQIALLQRTLNEILLVKARLIKAEENLEIAEARIKILDHTNVEAPGVQ